MIAVSDVKPFLTLKSIQAKIVDVDYPSLGVLEEIAKAAGLNPLPSICRTDADNKTTFVGYCNGGFYSIPKAFSNVLSKSWKFWALWLLDNLEPLRRVGREINVDQVSFWLAISQLGLPFSAAPSNVNYFTHFDGEHWYFDTSRPISLLHYHAESWDVLGFLDPPKTLSGEAAEAIAKANQQIGKMFDNRAFWEFRYFCHPERGSGVGSRGSNLEYKRKLLRQEGIETASSVLDVGCGDLEVLKAINVRNYLGIDQSEMAVNVARQARPDWKFRLAPAPDVDQAEMVLCLEVLIHQKESDEYCALTSFLTDKTRSTLIVSGFEADDETIQANSMLFFHEPLKTTLSRTGRFRQIREVGRHTNVVIYRCDV